MWRLLVFLVTVPIFAQPPAFSDLVDTAARRSGLWEAEVNLDTRETGFPEKIRGLILNIETRVQEASGGSLSVDTSAQLILEWERSIRRCMVPIHISGARQLTILKPLGCALPLEVQAYVDPESQTIDASIMSQGKSTSIKFVRPSFSHGANREFQGVWIASAEQLNRVVAFRISYSLGKAPLVIQDFVEPHFARLGEFWSSNENDHHLHASANRPAFNDTDFSASVVEGGNRLLAVQCGARMGLLCPATFRLAQDETAFGKAVRQLLPE